jgi:hypothetical protein
MRHASLLLLAACAVGEIAGEDASYAPAGPRFSYSDGDLVPDDHGEMYPVGTRPAEISFYQSTFQDFTCDYLSGCSVAIRALHRGLWNHTRQVMVVLADGEPVTSEQSAEGFGCRQWRAELGREVCVEKEAEHSEIFMFDLCETMIRGRTQHSAWWTGRWEFDVGLDRFSLNLGAGPHGLVHSTSLTPTSIQQPACGSESEGGGGTGGGGGTPMECFDVYGIWYDPDTGIVIESVFLYQYCTGGNVS